MDFLVIGLGSMGKRRIRCLQSLGYQSITGIDYRSDRRLEATDKYEIATAESINNVDLNKFDAYIISTPPDQHTYYAKLAIDYGKPAFIEGSVILEEVEEIDHYNKNHVFIAPSCTLRFHPLIKNITEIIKSGKYGKICNFTYHSGQYLPDWHPWEKVNEFYVGNRITGGGREIVPFELTWIVNTMGWPNEVKGYFSKTIDFGANIEDSYSFVLKYDNMLGSMIVDVAARYAIRNLVINLEKAQIQWRWDDGYFKLYEADEERWIKYFQPEIQAASGYNKNIAESMYVEEIANFIQGIDDPAKYSNSLKDDIRVLKLLKSIEDSDGGFN